MKSTLLKHTATPLAAQVAQRHIDIPLGFALLRDRRVPLSKKALALALGTLGMFLVQALEVPVELLMVVFASPFGFEDGLEAVVWPVLFACAILPKLVPQNQRIVETVVPAMSSKGTVGNNRRYTKLGNSYEGTGSSHDYRS